MVDYENICKNSVIKTKTSSCLSIIENLHHTSAKKTPLLGCLFYTQKVVYLSDAFT